MTKQLILLTALFCLAGAGERARAASICDAVAGNLITNCGFETGDFTGWTLTGNDVPGEAGNLYGVEGQDPVDSINPNSGSSQAYFADLVANATTLSQSFATNIGDTYAISFFLAQDTDPVGSYTNAFSASFGADSLMDTSPVATSGYTQYSFTDTAGGASTALSFTLGNDLGEFLLDDVVVTDLGAVTPEPSTWGMALVAIGLIAFVCRRPFQRAA